MNFKFSDNVEPLKPSAIREIFKSLTDPSVISFAAGNPSPLSFPVEKLRALADDIFETESAKSLQYGITEGYAPLREQVAARLKSKFSIGREDNISAIYNLFVFRSIPFFLLGIVMGIYEKEIN